MAENLLALREGRVDAAQLFEPVVEEALVTVAGHLWHVASERGPTTYTAFDPVEGLPLHRIFASDSWPL